MFLNIAALDRDVWGADSLGRYTPDGEHAWRVWVEYGYVAAAVSFENEVLGALVAFPTTRPDQYFLHKVFVDETWYRRGVGLALLEKLCQKADDGGLSLLFSTDPMNRAMLALSELFSFITTAAVKDFYGPGKDRLLRERSASDVRNRLLSK